MKKIILITAYFWGNDLKSKVGEMDLNRDLNGFH